MADTWQSTKVSRIIDSHVRNRPLTKFFESCDNRPPREDAAKNGQAVPASSPSRTRAYPPRLTALAGARRALTASARGLW